MNLPEVLRTIPSGYAAQLVMQYVPERRSTTGGGGRLPKGLPFLRLSADGG